MSWCHRCRVEYADLSWCPECGDALASPAPPERRMNASVAEAEMVVLATLPPEQALLASGRLDATGIPSALRDVGPGADRGEPVAVDVLVAPTRVPEARAVLSGRAFRRGASTLGTYLFVVTAAAVFLSGIVVVARWVLTGSPLP